MKPMDIVWNGRVVGKIEDVKGDHFELYGRWRPQPDISEFLLALEEDDEVEAMVEIGGPGSGLRETVVL